MLSKVSRKVRRAGTVLRHGGFSELVQKASEFAERKLRERTTTRRIFYKDFLFVNGCSLEHPSRYRVEHQMEQLRFNRLTCDSVWYENLTLDDVKMCRSIVFFRCPYTETVGEAIRLAKSLNKTVFFDIDDLVIDEVYVKDIKYLKTMSGEDLTLYMSGVERMQRTLRMCDVAITTTERLAQELRRYVDDVVINRNVASEKMVELSKTAIKNRGAPSHRGKVVIGYFSGSITHNDDVKLVLPVLERVLRTFPEVHLRVVGIIDLPEELKPWRDRVEFLPFMDWRQLPHAVADVDINIVPLESTIFNEAKSENKWFEVVLVKVFMIASRVGAFERMIDHGVTGLLCTTADEWFEGLTSLVTSPDERRRLGGNAHRQVLKQSVTAYSGAEFSRSLQERLSTSLAFVLPSTEISGGVNVVLQHARMAQRHGCDVTVLSMAQSSANVSFQGSVLPVVSIHGTAIEGEFDKMVATLWSTLDFVRRYPGANERFYLVQNFETDFYDFGHPFRVHANSTYNERDNVTYITISKWCENWLRETFGRPSRYAPNGIDVSKFAFVPRTFEGRVRVLIEGNSADHYKNVDESFEIANKLDKSRFEVWYLSYRGEPKPWYKVDRFLHKVPHDKVAEVYQSCHILLKSSLLESFSYPPLEMMATGGFAVVAPNGGNAEYLVDNHNCLLYQQGSVDSALRCIERICDDDDLRERLTAGARAVVEERDWSKVEESVLRLYGVERRAQASVRAEGVPARVEGEAQPA